MKYSINITGRSWVTCYLQEMPNRKNQVLDDLQKEIDSRGSISVAGDQFEIDVLDHSMAFEFFEIVNIDQKAYTVEMIYTGGAS